MEALDSISNTIEALDGISIAFITESWLTENSGNIINNIISHGFNIHGADRGSRGGGIAVLYRKSECLSLVFPEYISSSLTSFEHLAVRLITPHVTYCIICIYRKHGSNVDNFLSEIDNFLSEIDILLEYVINTHNDTIIVLGDFNVHFDVPEKRTIDVINAFENYQLGALVTEPTHNRGHTLDQIMYNKDTLDLSEPSVHTDLTHSDHYPISFTLPCGKDYNKSSETKELINYRKLKEVDVHAFRQMVIENLKPWYSRGSDLDNFTELCAGFKKVLQSALDHHAPLLTMRVTSKPTICPPLGSMQSIFRKEGSEGH